MYCFSVVSSSFKYFLEYYVSHIAGVIKFRQDNHCLKYIILTGTTSTVPVLHVPLPVHYVSARSGMQSAATSLNRGDLAEQKCEPAQKERT